MFGKILVTFTLVGLPLPPLGNLKARLQNLPLEMPLLNSHMTGLALAEEDYSEEIKMLLNRFAVTDFDERFWLGVLTNLSYLNLGQTKWMDIENAIKKGKTFNFVQKNTICFAKDGLALQGIEFFAKDNIEFTKQYSKSLIEKYFALSLRERGLKVETDVFIDGKYEIDYLVEDKFILCINGPPHYQILNIFKQTKKNKIHNEILEKKGYMVVEVHYFYIIGDLIHNKLSDNMMNMIEKKIRDNL